jgi:hypothetical protein
MQISAYILSITSIVESLSLGKDYFSKMSIICQKIQAILDALSEHGEDVHDSEDEVADWSGHVALDKPVTRWGVVAQICARESLSGDEVHAFEQILKESIRVAPHVEKRWVIRALVKLNTEDAVKAILYQAFQHVDGEFVGHHS